MTMTGISAVPSVFIDELTEGYDAVLARGMDFLRSSTHIRAGDRVTIKPNLTFPRFRPGVMTTPEAVEATLRHVSDYTNRITICESDSGGYNAFSMSEVFAATGIDRIAARYGARVVNLSHQPARTFLVRTSFRRLKVPLPTLVVDDTDLFITMPVPKVHSNAVISVAIKNQWGIIQEPSRRLDLHPYFKYVVYAVNKALPRSMAIVDGRYGLTRSGPMSGDVVESNWLLLSDNVFYTDLFVANLMGFDPRRIPYLEYVRRQERLAPDTAARVNQDAGRFKSEAFYLQRAWTDYPGLLTFNFGSLAYLGYKSPLSKPLHRLLYLFREPFY